MWAVTCTTYNDHSSQDVKPVHDRVDLKLRWKAKVQWQVNMVRAVTRWWQMYQKNLDKKKKRMWSNVKQRWSQTAKVQWSADDMLSIKSNQSGCEAWKKKEERWRRGFNLQETIAMAFTVMGYYPCSLQIRTLHCDSAKPQNSSLIICSQTSWLPGSFKLLKQKLIIKKY